MKKILSFLLVLVLGLTIVGCGEKEVAVTSVSVSSEKTEYVVGDSFTLTAKVSPTDATNKKVAWSSSDDSVATIDQSGKATALKAGSVKFTAKAESDESKKGEVTITIKEKAVEIKVSSVAVEITSESLVVGEEATIVVKVAPDDATNKDYTLNVSDQSVVSVTGNKVKALKAGQATITATAKDGSGVSGQVVITVTEDTAKSIEITGAKEAMAVGEEVSLTVNVKPVGSEYELVSSNPEVVKVEGTKLVALAAGEATITATLKADSQVKAEVKVTVTGEEKLIVVNPKKALEVGSFVELNYLFASGDDQDVIWMSSDDTIATVEEDGTLTGVAAGKATITCKAKENDNLKYTFELTVFDVGMGLTDFEVLISETDIFYDVDTYNLKYNVFPSTTLSNNYDLRFTSSDESVATVTNRGVLTTIKEGTITITVLDDVSGVEHEYTITVIKSPKLESLEIQGREITIEETITLSVKETPAHANYDLVWEALTPEFATITETGYVKPLKEGEAKFKVTDKTTGISDEYTLLIKEPFNPNQPPESITIFVTEKKVIVGYTLQLKVEVSPVGVSSSIIWEIHDSSKEYATISEDGLLKGIAEGSARVRAVSAVDSKVKSAWLTIKVEKAPELPAIPDLKGYQIIMMNAASALIDVDPFLEGYNQSDKTYKQKAWDEVEKEYNCDLVVLAYPDVAPWGPARINWIIDNATNGTSQCDFGVVSGAWINTFSQANAAVDTTNYFRKYGMNQVESALKEVSSSGDKYHAVSMGLNPIRTYVIGGLFYNYGLVKKLGLKSPAELFNEGKWTFNGFLDWCLEAQKLLGENEYVCSGGPSMYWSGMVNAAGVKLADKTQMTLNITHAYSLQAIEILRKVVENNCYAIDEIGYDEKCAPFQEGRAIFQPGEYWFVGSDNRWPDKLWGEDTQYGYVPYPYPDSVAKEDTKVNFVGESIMMMVAGKMHPQGVDEEGIYRAVQDMNLRTIQYMNEDPLFNAEDIKRNAVASRIDDPASVDATIFYTGSRTLFDPLFDESFAYHWSGDLPKAILNSVKGNDASQELSAIYDSVLNAFLKQYGA